MRNIFYGRRTARTAGILFLLSIAVGASARMDKSFFRELQEGEVESSNAIEWQPFGPGMSGYCEEFWCHPSDTNVMFMSPDMFNSYGTWDNGQSWKTIKNCDGNGRDMRRIQSIAFSYQDEDFGFALNGTGELYQTIDWGKSWEQVPFPGHGKYSEIVVDPTHDENWYIGAGCFWDVKHNHRSQKKPFGEKNRYAAYGHIYVTTDRGKTWELKDRGLPEDLDVGSIVVDPSDPMTIIMAASSGVYRSIDQGDSWVKSSRGLPNNLPRDMTAHVDEETEELTLYLVEQTVFEPNGRTVTSRGGVYKSTDHGRSWENITGNLAVDLSQINNRTARDKYFGSIGFWFGLSKAEAQTQYPELPKDVLSIFNRIRVNPLNKDEIYLTQNLKHDLAFIPGDIWKTSDGGKHWVTASRAGSYWGAKKDGAYWASRNNAQSPNVTFSHLRTEMAGAQADAVGNRFLEINSAGELFACIEQQVIRSDNNGESWEQIDDHETAPGSNCWVGRGDSNLPGRYMLLETGITNRYLFCSGEHGLWQTAPLGSFPDKKAIAVKQIEGQVHHGGATSISSVAVNPKDPNMIYILMFRQNHRGQFRRTTDGGKTWENVGFPLEYGGSLSEDHIFQYSLQVDFDNPDNIYFCVISNPVAEVQAGNLPKDFKTFGVLKSSDGGKTWKTANTGLPDGCSVRRVIINPHNSSELYAALNEGKKRTPGGLFKSVDRAESWKQVDIPSEIKSVNNVFIDRSNQSVYISCGSKSGIVDGGGVWRSKKNDEEWDKIFEMPNVWQAETSPINPRIVTVVVGPHKKPRAEYSLNPGAYLSINGGSSWKKVNKNLGQPDGITDFKPDPYSPDVYWAALWGSGWNVGYRRGTSLGWEELNAAAAGPVK